MPDMKDESGTENLNQPKNASLDDLDEEATK